MKETTGEHIKVAVQVTHVTVRESNLCNVLRGNFTLPVAGEAPSGQHVSGPEVSCKACRARLIDLGLALEALIPLRPEILAERERAYAARRLEWHRPTFVQAAQAVAADLRRKADEVERLVARYETAPSSSSTLVAELQHQVLWMLANLNLDTLTSRAAELDQIAREAR